MPEATALPTGMVTLVFTDVEELPDA